MTQRLKNIGWVAVGAIVLYWAATTLVGTVFGGPLDPPAAPAPTGKTQIDSLPYTITSSGSYILMSDLACPTCTTSSDPGIKIDASQVDIDLNGFTLFGPGTGAAAGIQVVGTCARDGIRIHNGSIGGWGHSGIDAHGASGSVFENLRLGFNGEDGITLGCANTVTDIISGGNVGAGIDVDSTGTDNRVEGNSVIGNTVGIEVDGGGNLVVKNSATANAINYLVNGAAVPPNTVGPEYSGGSPISTDPWANFTY